VSDPRRLGRAELARALGEARAATLRAALDLSDADWRVPYHAGIQPTAWDLAHVAWFAEFWMLRGPHRIGVDAFVSADRPAELVGPDAVYDSARIGHRERWEVELYRRAELVERLERQLEACTAALARAGDADGDLYHARFALYHELMHCEALAWTRALLGHPAPAGLEPRRFEPRPEVEVAAGRHHLGCRPTDGGFAFDNELPGREVELAAFAIDSAPVTNGEFRRFVEAGGYARAELWPGPAGAWRARARRELPARWRRGASGALEERWFDAWRDLPDDLAVIHVNAFEAEAYCRFAGRRLPSAAEWEVAAPRLQWGNSVWEWTADPFAPYPGFRPAPYHTYSAPWFHVQRELRGGSFAAHALLHGARYRNFFAEWRSDVFAGFRSAAR
jgi:ergothioneine biosynthesis protein EgtB